MDARIKSVFRFGAFFAGDGIWFISGGSPSCTSRFSFTGNNSGNTFMLTAGHCGGAAAWTNNTSKYYMGPISTDYYANGTTYDIETVRTSTAGKAWGENGTEYPIIGTQFIQPPNAVTFSGMVSNEVNGVAVTATNLTIAYPNGRKIYPVSKAEKSGYTVCQGGDSGAPVFVRTDGAGSKSYAVGIFVATYVVNGVPDYSK
jgi:hypothetical protein